jgi:hypothetical protein
MIKLSDLFKLPAKNKKKALPMAELKRKIDACGVDFPMELSGLAGDYPDRTVIPRPVRVGDETIAGLFLFCPEMDMDYFKIRIPPPEPDIKFRFLEYELFSVIEVLLLFEQGTTVGVKTAPCSCRTRPRLQARICSSVSMVSMKRKRKSRWGLLA